MIVNAVTAKDGYKADHRSQYPQNTEQVYSNFTPRTTKYMLTVPSSDDKIVCFGLQYFIKWYLIEQWNESFFNKPKEEVLKKYKRRINNYLGPDAITFDHIEALHDLGYLPIELRALPEGSVINAQIPMVTITNTLEEFFWLPNFFETIMSCMLWQGSTSATMARKYRILLDSWADRTGGSKDFVMFQGHDFSMRGMPGLQAAMMSGAGHLTSFAGTDTIPAIDFVEDYYNADSDKELVGANVAATEHSVMCMGSKGGEIDTFKRLITETYPSGIVSIVSDTWDYWKVVTEFLPKLKDIIMARTGGAFGDKVTIRPDSGDPADIICGTNIMPTGDTPQEKGSIQCLWDTFGGTVNEEGYKILDPHIGLIYGDSITLERANDICRRLELKGFASTNVVFGIGSFTYQYVTRDSLGFAMKATAGKIAGETVEIFKDPKTDDGMKKSAKGFLRVDKTPEGDFELTDQVTEEHSQGGALVPVFKDGKLLVDDTLDNIRKRIAQGPR